MPRQRHADSVSNTPQKMVLAGDANYHPSHSDQQLQLDPHPPLIAQLGVTDPMELRRSSKLAPEGCEGSCHACGDCDQTLLNRFNPTEVEELTAAELQTLSDPNHHMANNTTTNMCSRAQRSMPDDCCGDRDDEPSLVHDTVFDLSPQHQHPRNPASILPELLQKTGGPSHHPHKSYSVLLNTADVPRMAFPTHRQHRTRASILFTDEIADDNEEPIAAFRRTANHQHPNAPTASSGRHANFLVSQRSYVHRLNQNPCTVASNLDDLTKIDRFSMHIMEPPRRVALVRNGNLQKFCGVPRNLEATVNHWALAKKNSGTAVAPTYVYFGAVSDAKSCKNQHPQPTSTHNNTYLPHTTHSSDNSAITEDSHELTTNSAKHSVPECYQHLGELVAVFSPAHAAAMQNDAIAQFTTQRILGIPTPAEAEEMRAFTEASNCNLAEAAVGCFANHQRRECIASDVNTFEGCVLLDGQKGSVLTVRDNAPTTSRLADHTPPTSPSSDTDDEKKARFGMAVRQLYSNTRCRVWLHDANRHRCVFPRMTPTTSDEHDANNTTTCLVRK